MIAISQKFSIGWMVSSVEVLGNDSKAETASQNAFLRILDDEGDKKSGTTSSKQTSDAIEVCEAEINETSAAATSTADSVQIGVDLPAILPLPVKPELPKTASMNDLVEADPFIGVRANDELPAISEKEVSVHDLKTVAPDASAKKFDGPNFGKLENAPVAALLTEEGLLSKADNAGSRAANAQDKLEVRSPQGNPDVAFGIPKDMFERPITSSGADSSPFSDRRPPAFRIPDEDGKGQQVERPESTSKLDSKPQISNAENTWRERWTKPSLQDIEVSAPDGAQAKQEPEFNFPELGPQLPRVPRLLFDQPLVKIEPPNDARATIVSIGNSLKQNAGLVAAAQAPAEMQVQVASPSDAAPRIIEDPAKSVDSLSLWLDSPTAAKPDLPVHLLPRSAGEVPTNSTPPGLPSTISPTIIEMTKVGNHGPVELALSPEELGRLTISITQEGEFVRVNVVADRPETLDLMRRHAGDLIADLRQSGLSGATLSFGQGTTGEHPKFAQTQTNDDAQTSVHLPPPDVRPSTPVHPKSKVGLDLRF